MLLDDRIVARIFVSNFLRYLKRQPTSSVVMQSPENRGIVDFPKRFGFVKRKSD